MPVRIVIADDHPPIVEAVSRYLADQEDVEVSGRAADGKQALALIERRSPDVALLDIRMPHASGVEIARQLSAEGAKTAVVLYTGEGERAGLLEALDAGARGFVLKEAPLEDLLRAIKLVASGGTYVDPALVSLIASPEATSRLPQLSKREREILRLVADGKRNDAVALQLSISPLTVQSHVKSAMRKLEADTRTHAVAEALRSSLIT